MDELQPAPAGAIRPPEGKPIVVDLKIRVVKFETVEALLYGCASWTPLKFYYYNTTSNKLFYVPHTTGCCFESLESGAGREASIYYTSIFSCTTASSSAPDARA